MTFSLLHGGVVMSSQITQTIIINTHPLAYILDTCALIFSSSAFSVVYPNRIINGIPPLSR